MSLRQSGSSESSLLLGNVGFFPVLGDNRTFEMQHPPLRQYLAASDGVILIDGVV